MSFNNNISLINLNSQFNPFYSSITIDPSGKVGVGKTNPSDILDVSGNIKLSGVISGSGADLISLNATNITDGVLSVRCGGTGATTLTSGSILVGNERNTILQPTNLVWDNVNSRVGIGVTNPASKFHIIHNSTGISTFEKVGLLVQNTSNTASNNSWILNQIAGSSANKVIYSMDVSGGYGWSMYLQGSDTTNRLLRFNSSWDATGGTDRLVINGANGNVGIATLSTSTISSRLTINDIVVDRGTFDHSESPLTITHQTATSTTVLNDPKAVLHLCRQGTGGQATGARASFKLCRWENNSTNSRTRLDIALAHGAYDDINIMSIQSNGNVGIGTINPTSKLHVSGDTRIEGNLTVNGTLTQINTNVGTTEQLLITNDGTGPAVIVNQTGAQPIIDIQDDGSTCFKIFDGGHIGIGTNTKTVNVDVSGNITLSGIINGNGSGLTSLNMSALSGTLSVGKGGTGATTLTSGQLLIGNNTNPLLQTPNLTWDTSNNRLGIGKNNPGYVLDVNGAINATELRVNGTIYKPATALLADTATTANSITSANLASSLNTSHFTNNTTTNKIDINTSFKPTTAGTADSATTAGTATTATTATTANSISSANLISSLNTSHFTNNAGKIDLVNGSNQWTAGTGLISYNSGNVIIGTTTNSSDDGNTNFVIPDATLYVKGGAITGGTLDVVFRGGVAGQNGGKSKLWMTSDAGHSSYIQNEHTSSGNTILTFGTAASNALPVERMRIDNNGNVGIGKTPGYLLDVNGAINATELRVNGSVFTSSSAQWGTSGSNLFYTAGNIGLGTSTINERLTISGTAARQMMLTCTVASTSSYMGFSNSANDSLAYIGVDGLGFTNIVYGALTLGTWKDKPILFTTGATNTEKMRIDSSGNVGIGVTNPINKLQIVHSSTSLNADTGTGVGLYVFNPTNTASNNSIICNRIGGSTANKVIYSYDVSTQYGWSTYILGSDTTNRLLRFHSAWDGTGGVDRMVINGANGNVGIGTVDPQASLDIVKSTAVATTVDLLNMRTDANWGVKLQQNYSAAGNIQYNFIHRYNATDYNSLTFKGANVGIGKTNPGTALDVSGTVTATTFSGSGASLTGLPAANITGTLPVSNGGTGAATLAAGQLLVGNVTGALIQSANLVWDNTNSRVGIGKTNPGTALDVTGTVTATTFSGSGASLTGLPAANITGTLPVSNGGTGAATLAAGQLLVGNLTGALIQSANLVWDNTNSRLGIGVTPLVPLHVAGAIAATGDITAYYSDVRLKNIISKINDPLKIINNLNGFYYTPNELAHKNGIIHTDKEIGLSAQDVQKVLPELVKIAPFDLARDKDGKLVSKSGENYLTVSYDRLAPVFVEAIKALQKENNDLKEKYDALLQDMILIKKTLNLI